MDGGFKLEQLMGYLNGPDFHNRMNALIASVAKLEQIQQKERTSHDRTWKEQGEVTRSITMSSNDIDSEIKAILLGR